LTANVVEWMNVLGVLGTVELLRVVDVD